MVPIPVTLTTLDLTWTLAVLQKTKLKLAWEPSKHLDPWDLVLYLRSDELLLFPSPRCLPPSLHQSLPEIKKDLTVMTLETSLRTKMTL
jgi:hypothetical protein